MHKIQILLSNNETQTLEYEDFSVFIVKYSMFKVTHSEFIDVVIDEDLINIFELKMFLSELLGQTFTNPDNCNTVEELLEWTKAFQFISFLDEEIG